MFVPRITPVLVLSLLVVSGCGQTVGKLDPPSPDVVAAYGGGVITQAQLQSKFDSLMPCCKGRYEGIDGRKTLLKEMMLPQVIAQTIKEKKIDFRGNIRKKLGDLTDELNMSFLHMKFHEDILNTNPKYTEIKEQYEDKKRILEGRPLSERYGLLVKLHEEIHPQIEKEVEEVSKAYIERLQREASIKKNFDLLQIKVADEELRDFYQKHKEGLHSHEYREPEKIRVNEIRIDVSEAEKKEDAKQKADTVLDELRSGARFQTVAKKFTGDAGKYSENKWISRAMAGGKFETAVFSLDAGEISPVIEKDNAYYVLKVLEKKPARFKSFHEITEALTREYRWQKADEDLKEKRDRILFTVNGKPYTIGDFSDEYKRSTPAHQCHHMAGKDHQNSDMAGMDHPKSGAANTELCELAHHTIDEQLKLADRMVDRELIIEDTYNQMINVEHQKEIEFLTMASLYPVFHKEEMERMIHVTDKMVEDYYKKHKGDYHYPAKAKISMIVVRGGEKEEERKAAHQKALKAYRELKPSFFSFAKGKDFAEMARTYSEDPETAAKGGRLDVDIYECRNAVEYAMLHGFHQKVFSVKPGDISDVFEYGKDYYILQIRELETKKQATFDEVRALVRKDLMDKEHQKVMVNWEDDLLKSAGYTLYDKPINEMLVAYEEQQKTEKS